MNQKVRLVDDSLASWAMAVKELNLSASSEYMRELIEEGGEHLMSLRDEYGTVHREADAILVKGIEARLAKAEELLRQRLLIEAEQAKMKERQAR
ncbi:MAG: hypothetical protein A3J09_01805 [Candidatus Zambryskibacteria bacterium RIFCSPLOWO2_02_FULL_51_21]|uniref:Uncharacterized protein n=1 Tax=Candidatus Zambryskibacteria bacterium RIFCSPHIGHO2_02_FULL_43_37 TaxID=1802749 RepID=A0A1G2TGN7_9BACT|nr:MAG: hypothetical protein A2723_01805 [Candidatus Zambryskibacteria bacterium RIFCSPHIGHO2_01_FULL_52_18]OHA96466.1 MAG: hypothetical protein A3D49_01095 [Candidatus Zambryskibacteria bacterium RIFCSPHIGHO2_02_FULL_43_37]OHB07231.1 MAG: hypothetical protein A2944_01545 [Candidatus Zambryskibacteria bacterium RIFCSPLOWO2_01_FULL_52_12]OHB11271.1 MAG: hypothetical protein A3J09_01805 [Candidatus Zambryskibacteria bacterium RIFCSPLOWO2_02_FULL_51_21]